MLTRSEDTHTSQNIGLFDRTVRLVIGVAMLAGGAVYVSLAGLQFMYEPASLVMILLSIYPLLTALFGIDPIYSAAGIRSCRDNGRNQCGSLPYQIKAAMGKAPAYCESDDERSLENCHDKPEANPHHANWRVDQNPMLYPDDKAMSDFADRERKLNLRHK